MSKRFSATTMFSCLLGSLLVANLCFAVDPKDVEKLLTTTGVEGEVHGAASPLGLYVFTYRNPTDFFDFIEMSLVSEKPETMKFLGTLNRHDRVRIKGAFLDNPSPQKHIDVAAVEVVKKYESSYPSAPYEYEAKVPDELLDKDSALFLVHAVHENGQILVVEYKDIVLPIFVKNGALSKDLWRGDLVRLKFRIQKDPGRPIHLRVRETEVDAIQLVEAVKSLHGKTGSLEGTLVLFPKSPEIKFNVFALLQELPEGLKRQYTLVNFDNPDTFAKIRDLLQKAWDKYPNASINGRNKLLSTKIRVKATGTFNEVSPNQANPQILLPTLESIQIIEK